MSMLIKILADIAAPPKESPSIGGFTTVALVVGIAVIVIITVFLILKARKK